MNSQEFWKRKLMAFLHDPPCKCFDIPTHQARARSFRESAGISAEDYKAFKHECDKMAAAADRFPFPDPNRSGLKSQFTGGADAPFRHPFGGDDFVLSKLIETATAAEEHFQKSIGGVPPNLDWKAKFFLYWRRWPEEAALHDPRLAFLPADTRMPDHTIWSHMSLTSALQACVEDGELKPAFLLFQLGGVQDFIGQARSTRDLWSGSYLISWLMAHAMKAIADQFGPDCIIFPSLRGQPIFDALYREEIFSKIPFNEDTLWTLMYPNTEPSARILLSPTLPNRFLAVVPQSKAADLGIAAEKALKKALKNEGALKNKNELTSIADACWRWLSKQGADTGWLNRWEKQLDLFPQITWQICPWESDWEKLGKRYEDISFKNPKNEWTPAKNFESLLQLAVNEEHRDSRCFQGDRPNIGFAWPAHYAAADFLHAARRNTRDFPAFNTDPHQRGARKDALSGREEIIGDKEFWGRLSSDQGGPFYEDSPLGAMNMIKRLWCRTEAGYLVKHLGLEEKIFKRAAGYDSVPEVAQENILTERERQQGRAKSKYVAVIAMDGDRMGKWIAGVKTPPWFKQLSREAQDHYMGKLKENDLHRPRPLSPAFHLQFSEALSNFTRLAGPIVEHFKGQLIYAGGDDVVAMVPATRALDCAYVLRCAFRGEEPGEISKESTAFTDSWVGLKAELDFWPHKGWMTRTVREPNAEKKLPLILPGPKADISCGIAIAYEKHPLQAIVRKAQHVLNKIAKKHFDRGAFAVKLLKRGGEHTIWGARWKSPALNLYHHYCRIAGLTGEQELLSGRFPYALAELLRPYRLPDDRFETGFNPAEVIPLEFARVVERQNTVNEKPDKPHPDLERLRTLAGKYLDALATSDGSKQPRKGRWDEFEKLFLTAAFIFRARGDE